MLKRKLEAEQQRYPGPVQFRAHWLARSNGLHGSRGSYRQDGSTQVFPNRGRMVLDEKDDEVAAAIVLFKSALETAQAQLGSVESNDGPVTQQARIDFNSLIVSYRESTNHMFKKVFNRTLKEFFQQFPTIFIVEGSQVRLTTETEAQAIRANEAETAAKLEAVEAEKKRRAEEKQREILQRIYRERKLPRDRAINVVVASTSAVKVEAVRRALIAVLAHTRARPYSRVVVCGSKDCPSEINEQPYGEEDTLRGAYNRLSHAVKRRILLPPMSKSYPRTQEEAYDPESLYRVILPENLAQALKEESDSRGGDDGKKDETGEDSAQSQPELLPGEERELVVADYYVAIENGVMPVKLPDVNLDLPTFPEQEGAESKAEEKLPEFSADDKQKSGVVYVDIAWVVIYNSRTGLTVRIPSTGNEFPANFVDKSREGGFQTTCGSLLSDHLSAELEMKVDSADPHKTLNAGVLSRGHLLEQALTVGFAQLTHKEMARKRIAALARMKELAAQRAKEEQEKALKQAEEAAAAAQKESENAASAPADSEMSDTAASSNEPATANSDIVIHTPDRKSVV